MLNLTPGGKTASSILRLSLNQGIGGGGPEEQEARMTARNGMKYLINPNDLLKLGISLFVKSILTPPG
jgi:hypothetical protein